MAARIANTGLLDYDYDWSQALHVNRYKEEYFAFLHGRTYTLHGVRGVFEYTQDKAIYPGLRVYHRLYHKPDSVGRKTVEYRAIRAILHDDHVTDLTDSDTLYDVLRELGYTPANTGE